MDTHSTTPPTEKARATRLQLVCGLATWIAIGSVAAAPFFGVRAVGEALLQACLFVGVFGAVCAGYMAPALYAYAKDHPQWRAIAVLNILLGSTGIGWAAAMVWAFMRPAQPPAA